MARCDEGYLCDVCGEEVESVRESDLYLRLVIGEVTAAALPSAPERHIRCNPVQAQFIVDPDFKAIAVEGPFDRRELDPEDSAARTSLITRGWQRLQEIASLEQPLPFSEYPLAEVRKD